MELLIFKVNLCWGALILILFFVAFLLMLACFINDILCLVAMDGFGRDASCRGLRSAQSLRCCNGNERRSTSNK